MVASALLLGNAGLVLGQETVTTAKDEEAPAATKAQQAPRACEGRPARRVGTSILQTVGINVFYELANLARGQIYSLDGVRANHFLQHARVDFLLPLRGSIGVGTSAEFFHRRSYYQDAAQTIKTYHYPQLRAYFTWRN